MGLRAHISVDRTETRVGERVGVTVEVETPTGWALEPPAPPKSEHFYTESLELAGPQRLGGRVRHTLLWTLRARRVGDLSLPMLEVPIARPDGGLQRLAVGGVPLPVVSVRGELPERDVWFDIRPAPARERDLRWVVGGAALLLLAGGLLFLALRQRRREDSAAGPGSAELAARALDELDAALAELEPRALAGALQSLLLRFAAARWQIRTEALTPPELPDEVDANFGAILAALETGRFVAVPARERVVESAGAARSWLLDVVDG